MMHKKRNTQDHRKGQSILEYAMVAAIVSAAVIAMGIYVFRSVQSTQQMILEEARNQ
jgi:Flp pilus assembly pilin Flp